jgi:hypothetical protein
MATTPPRENAIASTQRITTVSVRPIVASGLTVDDAVPYTSDSDSGFVTLRTVIADPGPHQGHFTDV